MQGTYVSTFIRTKRRTPTLRYTSGDFLAENERILHLARRIEANFSRYAYNRVIRLRLSVQIVKLDFAIPALAHTWRVTQEGRFSEGGQGHGGVRRGRVSWQDQRRPAAIPYLLRDILRVN